MTVHILFGADELPSSNCVEQPFDRFLTNLISWQTNNPSLGVSKFYLGRCNKHKYACDSCHCSRGLYCENTYPPEKLYKTMVFWFGHLSFANSIFVEHYDMSTPYAINSISIEPI